MVCFFLTCSALFSGDTQAQSNPAIRWVTAQASAPQISFHTFESKHAKSKVSFHLFTPKSGAKEKIDRLPVTYWLHGTEGGLPGIRPLSAYFSKQMESGDIPAMYIVFVNGLRGGMYCDWKDGSVKLEQVIIKDLIPFVDRSFNTISNRSGRLIEGFSMGGYGAARLGFKYPDLFAAASLFGAGPMQKELKSIPGAASKNRSEIIKSVYGDDQKYFFEVSPWNIAEKNKKKIGNGLVVRQCIGSKDWTLKFNQDFHKHLESLGIKHSYEELDGVGHDMMGILNSLGEKNFEFYNKVLAKK